MSSNSLFVALNISPRRFNSNSPDSIKADFGAQPIFRNESLNETRDSFFEKDPFLAKRRNLSAPSPPPLPPPRFWEMFEAGKGRRVADDDLEREEEESGTKPKLKPLHWDKMRASSDRAMVWDQIKSSSFQLNEEMIETLFMVNGPGSTSSENTQRLNQENRVLDPKKSQNIAILLRALNVTVDEVCEALVEGTTDTLGTELLKSLLKMAPSEEEERKLKESKDDSPAKLSTAEKFLKTVVRIPFAFQRVEAMLYVSTFDSEVDYLKRSFDTLKAACEELKNSRMFRKLLDTVLQTGNRMNLGTERGDARAFKLDTLLKLVDIKGTDQKTSLLHFVVQEISRSEGSTNQGSTPVRSDAELRKLGLRVVSGLSSELDNVKKSADMDSDVLGGDVAKLSDGVGKVKDVLKVECGERFLGSMKEFLDQAEREIANVRSLERECSSSVKAITEYFHGESGKGDARIFKVVRDFVSILDCVCKEVGKVNNRGFVGSGLPDNSTAFPVFPRTMLEKES